MLVEFEQILWSKLHEILSFLTKNCFLNHFKQSVDEILEDVSVDETIVVEWVAMIRFLFGMSCMWHF